jgi:hypothetical protein
MAAITVAVRATGVSASVFAVIVVAVTVVAVTVVAVIVVAGQVAEYAFLTFVVTAFWRVVARTEIAGHPVVCLVWH